MFRRGGGVENKLPLLKEKPSPKNSDCNSTKNLICFDELNLYPHHKPVPKITIFTWFSPYLNEFFFIFSIWFLYATFSENVWTSKIKISCTFWEKKNMTWFFHNMCMIFYHTFSYIFWKSKIKKSLKKGRKKKENSST